MRVMQLNDINIVEETFDEEDHDSEYWLFHDETTKLIIWIYNFCCLEHGVQSAERIYQLQISRNGGSYLPSVGSNWLQLQSPMEKT